MLKVTECRLESADHILYRWDTWDCPELQAVRGCFLKPWVLRNHHEWCSHVKTSLENVWNQGKHTRCKIALQTVVIVWITETNGTSQMGKRKNYLALAVACKLWQWVLSVSLLVLGRLPPLCRSPIFRSCIDAYLCNPAPEKMIPLSSGLTQTWSKLQGENKNLTEMASWNGCTDHLQNHFYNLKWYGSKTYRQTRSQWFTAILSDNQSCMQWSLPKNPQNTDILEIYNKLQHSTLTANKLSPQQGTQSHHARAWTFQRAKSAESLWVSTCSPAWFSSSFWHERQPCPGKLSTA